MKASHLTYVFSQVIILESVRACIPSSNHTSADKYPINRYFNVTSDGPTPQLSCLVGFISLDSDRLFRFGKWTVKDEHELSHRTNCNDAADIELTLSVEDRKAQNSTGMWPVPWRKIRWKIQKGKQGLEQFDMVRIINASLVVVVKVCTVSF